MIAPRSRPPHGITPRPMSKRPKATCNDCYFRRAALCALAGETICPTFRTDAVGHLAPPPQPRLVPRGLAQLTTHVAA